MTIELVNEAVMAGARRESACEIVGLSARTLERWRGNHVEDMRRGPKTAPANKLTAEERATVLRVVNSPDYRDRSPNQIVPLLADEKLYVASESTMYRILREEDLLRHRGRELPRAVRRSSLRDRVTGFSRSDRSSGGSSWSS